MSTAVAEQSFVRSRIYPAARGVGRFLDRAWRRLVGKSRPQEDQSLLPLVIQVLAAFSKSDGQVVEEEIDVVLGLLRHGYPDALYSDLRRQFRDALSQQQDVAAMGERLSRELNPEQKVMLGVQLYDLIARAGKDKEQMPAFYAFMDKLGMAAQAIEIVLQLQGNDKGDKSLTVTGELPLEVLTFGRDAQADVWVKSLHAGERIIAFRYHSLVLVKNASPRQVFVRGRPLEPGAFCRIFAGQRVVLDEQVLTFQDITYYTWN
jgi:ABC transport system ATP-binding/permease protein